MRKLIPLAIASAFLLTMIIPVAAASLNPNKLYGAPTFQLNLVGKKSDWSGGGSYDNPDRHTMFIPQTANNVSIWMTQGTDWAVLDGNAFDEDEDCNFQLGAGKYAVFLVAQGKPAAGGSVRGWIYNATDNTYLLNIGSISFSGHSKTPKWENVTDLFWVSDTEDPYDLTSGETWVFDYIAALEGYAPAGEYLYLWDLTNNGNTLLKIRFYQIG